MTFKELLDQTGVPGYELRKIILERMSEVQRPKAHNQARVDRTLYTPEEAVPKATHCINGHEYTVENTYEYGTHRKCRVCNRERTKKSANKRKGATE